LVFIVGRLFVFFDLYFGENICLYFWSLLWGHYVLFYFYFRENMCLFFLNCGESMYILCLISDFGHGVNEISAFKEFVTNV